MRRPHVAGVLVLLGLLSLSAGVLAGDAPPPADRARLLAQVEALAAPRLHGRGRPEDREQAASLLVEAFRVAGLLPPPGREEFLLPLRPREGVPAGRHVAGWLPGREPGAWVLAMARFDGPDRPTGPIWPGADGNASGVAALLEAARALAAGPRPRRGILFVALDLSIRDREGSRRLAAEPPLPLEDCAVAVDVEYLGRSLADAMPGSLFLFASRIDAAVNALGPTTEAGAAPRVLGVDLCPLASTSALAFEDRGVPTILVTALPSRDDDSERDTPDRLDGQALARRTTRLTGLLFALADAVAPPAREPLPAPSVPEMEALASLLEEIGARADALGLTERERLRAGYGLEHVRTLLARGTWTKGDRLAARLFALEAFGALLRPR